MRERVELFSNYCLIREVVEKRMYYTLRNGEIIFRVWWDNTPTPDEIRLAIRQKEEVDEIIGVAKEK